MKADPHGRILAPRVGLSPPQQGARMDYAHHLAECPVSEYDAQARWLEETLPRLWHTEYRALTPRPTNVVRVEAGGFAYAYDLVMQLVLQGDLPADPEPEDRVVAAWGRSAPVSGGRAHEDARLRGWPVSREERDEKRWDRGHFIGHALGGKIDRAEVNVFRQLRAVNRGWNDDGKRYRKMEEYAAATPGTFVFSRPLYRPDIDTAHPISLEFGVLTRDRGVWVEQFPNE